MKLVPYKRPFIKVNSDFVENDTLKNCYQKVVYIYLMVLTDAEGKCSPSIKRLSRLTKISINKVKSTINELIQLGLVEKERRINEYGGTDTNLYTVYDLSKIGGTEDHPNEKKDFIKIRKDFFENDQLSSCQQKLIYLCLVKFAKGKDECYPTLKELSRSTKIGDSKVKSTINELEQKGMIDRKKIKIDKWNRNLYVLLYDLRS